MIRKLTPAAMMFALLPGQASAADALAAEPVDYVKVCDAFGDGFFYSPGTDSCIKIGGYVKFGTSFGDTDFTHYNPYYQNSRWDNFYTEASLQLTASSVTEFGTLTGFADIRAQTGNQGGFTQTLDQIQNAAIAGAYVDSAYLSLGPVKAGYFTSLFDFGRGYTDTGGFGSDTKTNHVEAVAALGPVAVAGSIESQIDRGAEGQTVEGVGAPNVPDVVGAVSYASGVVSAKVAAAYVTGAVDRLPNGVPYGSGASGFAVGGSLELKRDALSRGDRLFFTAAYGDNANSFTGIAGGTSVANIAGVLFSAAAATAVGTSWSALGSYKHTLSPKLIGAVTGGYAAFDGSGNAALDPDFGAWRAVASLTYLPVKGLEMWAEGDYVGVDDHTGGDSGSAWAVNLFMKRNW